MHISKPWFEFDDLCEFSSWFQTYYILIGALIWMEESSTFLIIKNFLTAPPFVILETLLNWNKPLMSDTLHRSVHHTENLWRWYYNDLNVLTDVLLRPLGGLKYYEISDFIGMNDDGQNEADKNPSRRVNNRPIRINSQLKIGKWFRIIIPILIIFYQK